MEGADLSAVRLRVEGADVVTLDDAGLRLSTAAGDLTLPLPASDRSSARRAAVERLDMQTFDVSAPFGRPAVAARSRPATAGGSPYPLLYATFLGGSSTDYSRAIAVDGAGQAYVTGYTYSADFPASVGPGYDTSFNGNYDAFVIKLDATGADLLYATFLGGSAVEGGAGIAVDSAGQAYVTGYTYSADFPASVGPGYDTSFNGHIDAFVVKLDATGADLLYATFLGGSAVEGGAGIAVDSAGQAYVTGYTISADFPASLGPGYDTSYNGTGDAFVVKLDATGAGLLYATFLGGPSYDRGNGIAVDDAGQAYVTGFTTWSDFPADLGPGYDTTYNGGDDAFVVALNATGASLRYATYLGGGDGDYGTGIAVDGAGQAYVTGDTGSADFPASLGPGYDTSYNGNTDAFVAALDAAGAGLRYVTFLGGSAEDVSGGIAVDGAGQAYVTGETDSANFPACLGPGYDTSYNGNTDAFVVVLDAAGAGLRHATYLGGSADDYGYGIAVDGASQACLTGKTGSANFPAGPGYDASYNGGESDAFVVALDAAATPLPTPTPTPTVTPTPTPTGAWASWVRGDRPLLVPAIGAAAAVEYGNLTPPVPLAAHVAGAALFDTGAISGTASISTTLPDGSGSYTMTLIPALGATAGQTLTVQVDIGPVTLSQDGWIAMSYWMPLFVIQ